MSDEMIQAYLWQKVIHTAFHPAGLRDQKKWLLEYGRSLNEFWESNSSNMFPKEDNGKIIGSICAPTDGHLILDFTIDSITKFAVRVLYFPPRNSNEVIWVHDVDGQYINFPSQSLLSACIREADAIRAFSSEPKDHMEKVVDGLLCHPMVHQHIESPVNDHEIRVGGGIDNPFLFLFHMRYQLCPILDKRNHERTRLVELFTDKIIREQTISANELMKVI